MNWDVAWKSLSISLRLWGELAAGSGGHVKNRLPKVEFIVTKHLPKVEVMWRIGFWKWYSLWWRVCQKWRSCEESASGSGIHCDEASAKSGGHVKNQLLEVDHVKQRLHVLVKVALCKMLLDQQRNFVKIYVHCINISHRADAGLTLTFINRTYTLHSMYESRTWYSILSRISFCFAN